MIIHKLDLSVVVASFCGALVWVMTQKYFNKATQPYLFTVSFIMGIIGADITIEIMKIIVPEIFSDARAIGAFVCSTLIITLIINITNKISSYFSKHDD